MASDDEQLNDFQKNVFGEYELIKGLDKSSSRISESQKKKRKGCLLAAFTVAADFIVGKIIDRERRKRNYDGTQREAAELLRQKEISDRICETIANLNRREVLTEERFVYEFTAALYRNQLAKQFVIPANAMLYALMATKVFKTGLEKFCNDTKGDQ